MEPKNKLNFHPTQVGYITQSVEPISVNLHLDDVLQMFEENEDLNSLPVEYAKGIGLIDRQLIEQKGKSFWTSLRNAEMDEYMYTNTLYISSREYIKKIFKKMAGSDKTENIKTFIVFHDGKYFGIVKYDDLITHISDLQEWEISQAKNIQQFLLSKNNIDDNLIDLKANLQMAHELGGDFYQVLNVTENIILISSFDVSGKNISAALLTIMINSFFTLIKQKKISNVSNPYKILTDFNQFVFEQTSPEQYVASLFLFIFKKEQKVEIYNFGYTSPCIIKISDNKTKALFLNSNYAPIGIGDKIDFSIKPYKYPISSLRSAFMFSDGLIDALNEHGERFGEDRIKEFIIKNYKKMGSDFLDEMNKELNRFIRETPQADDITSIILHFDQQIKVL
jgi:phosphoserine phosphatase RsbU/P